MEYAKNVNQIKNAFKLSALRPDESFFFVDTIQARYGNVSFSPFLDLEEECVNNQDNYCRPFVLCRLKKIGTSSEINHFVDDLRRKRFPIAVVSLLDMSILNQFSYKSVLAIICNCVIKIALEVGIHISQADQDYLISYLLSDYNVEHLESNENTLGIDCGAKVETPSFFSKIISVFVDVDAKSSISETNSIISRYDKIKYFDDWIERINDISTQIKNKCSNKWPILVFDDIDIMCNNISIIDEKQSTLIWDILISRFSFFNHFKFPIVFTFPYIFNYHDKYQEIISYYNVLNLYPIRAVNDDYSSYLLGYNTILSIISKRCDTSLFADGVLKFLIEMVGASLEQLFEVIEKGAKVAARKDDSIIDFCHVYPYIQDIKRRIQSRIIDDNIRQHLINVLKQEYYHQDEITLRLINDIIILEYTNEDGNVSRVLHPLALECLRELKYIK